jgi:hypothetical protein
MNKRTWQGGSAAPWPMANECGFAATLNIELGKLDPLTRNAAAITT